MFFLILPRNKRTVYKYVDAFHGGRILSEAECLEFLNGRVNVPVQSWTLFPKATPRQVKVFSKFLLT